MISVLFKAWINKILKWCFHLGTCAHCMLLMLASVYCRIKNSLSKHHHPCNVCHKLDKFHTHFLHQRLIGDSSLCWWIDGIQEQVKFKKFLLEISRCKLLRWSCRFFYLAWFTCLSIKWIAASENVQRHSAFLNEAIPSFKPFMYFPNAGSPGYISFGGENMYVGGEFLFWRLFESIIFFICVLGGKNANCTFCPIYD